jgi:hypothetical protein
VRDRSRTATGVSPYEARPVTMRMRLIETAAILALSGVGALFLLQGNTFVAFFVVAPAGAAAILALALSQRLKRRDAGSNGAI